MAAARQRLLAGCSRAWRPPFQGRKQEGVLLRLRQCRALPGRWLLAPLARLRPSPRGYSRRS